MRTELYDGVFLERPRHVRVCGSRGNLGILQQSGRGSLCLRDVREMLQESLGLYKFDEKNARMLLKAADFGLNIVRSRSVWHRCRHVSFIFKGSRILSVGVNSKKTHPLNSLYPYVGRLGEDITSFVGTHSEMKAVLNSSRNFSRGMKFVNLRLNRNMEFDSSRPCLGCEQMLSRLGFSEVFHTNSDGTFSLSTICETKL